MLGQLGTAVTPAVSLLLLSLCYCCCPSVLMRAMHFCSSGTPQRKLSNYVVHVLAAAGQLPEH